MESIITLYYFIFNKPFSANKQHKYTHNQRTHHYFRSDIAIYPPYVWSSM